MADTVYVNLHTHTVFSDGASSPEVLADRLAAAGVRYAALTDHDTLEGLAQFRAAADAKGIPTLPGVELTARLDGRMAHLVAYGFDPTHPELLATLARMRHGRDTDFHTLTSSLRAAGRHRQADSAATPAVEAANDGHLDVGDAIALIQRAGGRAFLAHPLVLEPDLDALEVLVVGLKGRGLDGIEAVYDEFNEEQRALLTALARRHDLLVCAGTDYHAIEGLGSRALGIEMPHAEWLRFRSAVLDGPGLVEQGPDGAPSGQGAHAGQGAPAGQAAHAARVEPPESALHAPRRPFVVRVVLPAAAALVLFLVALWVLVLPSFEQTLLERKREMIRELTNSAWSVLAAYEADERSGLLTREEAQAAAARVISELRYGEDRLDYFWIQDTTPKMIMHPYRTDLDGQDLSGFEDPRGVPIFVEFADLVKRAEEGYVDYVWQWFDDPGRLEPKESYVKGFEPWGWIIGTGLYTDDVRAEIDRIQRNLLFATLAISGLIALLLLFVLQQSLRIERRREEGLERLRDSNARYHALIEATTEGTLLVIEGRSRYANPTFLRLLGYSARQLEFLELADLLPRGSGNEPLWRVLDAGGADDADSTGDADSAVLGVGHEGVLKRSDGSLVECVLTLDPVAFGDAAGHVLLARDITAAADDVQGDASALGTSVGVFRAVAARRGVFTALSPAARRILTLAGGEDLPQPALADLFVDAADFGRSFHRLLDEGEVRDQILTMESAAGTHAVLLSAALVRDEEGEPAHIDGVLVDVTAARDEVASREIQQLRASMLFLHASVGSLAKPAPTIGMETSLSDAAMRMTEREVTAALVASGSGVVIGIVTDHDLRARVVAQRRSLDEPVESVMTAPLIRIHRGRPVYEALLRMEDGAVGHLAVEDDAGHIVGVVDRDDLVGSPRFAPLVLLADIARAATPDEVAHTCEHTLPAAAALLGSSARPRHVNSMLTSVFDAVSSRLIELALADLGPAPSAFAFFAMGSQGRGEVHLSSDQDNGIVYALPPDAASDAAAPEGMTPAGATLDAAASRVATPEVADYFLRLGAHVSDGLHAAGYPYCRGSVMASDPRWCRSLPEWIATYDAWLRRAEPQDVTELSVFLDFRLVHGDAGLIDAIRRHIHETLPDQRGVHYQLARNALTFRPPLRLPGNIYLGGAAEQSGRIDLKDALQPMVAYARVDAARHRIDATHTLGRIVALADRGLLPSSSREEISDAYDFLMGLRLATQLADVQAGRTPLSVVEPAKLSHTQQELLRGAFTQIANLQKTAENEFPEAG